LNFLNLPDISRSKASHARQAYLGLNLGLTKVKKLAKIYSLHVGKNKVLNQE
jgi:hypothetical protein